MLKPIAVLLTLAAIVGVALLVGLGRPAAAPNTGKNPAKQAAHDSPRDTRSPPIPGVSPSVLPAAPRMRAREALRADEEAANARGMELVQARLRAFEAAPEDSDWAPGAASSLRTDLSELSDELGFTIDSLRCKTKVCVARIAWDSVSAAVRDNQRIAEASYSVSCAVTVLGNIDGPNKVSMSVMFSECQ
jgi:hypothetical protein